MRYLKYNLLSYIKSSSGHLKKRTFFIFHSFSCIISLYNDSFFFFLFYNENIFIENCKFRLGWFVKSNFQISIGFQSFRNDSCVVLSSLIYQMAVVSNIRDLLLYLILFGNNQITSATKVAACKFGFLFGFFLAYTI